jgi:hypothetical protein
LFNQLLGIRLVKMNASFQWHVKKKSSKFFSIVEAVYQRTLLQFATFILAQKDP